MFRIYDKSEAAKQHRISIAVFLILSLFILSSQSVIAAQNTPVSMGQKDSGKIFQDCMLEGGHMTNLPNGGSRCCVGKYCTSCTGGKCSTTCNFERQPSCWIVLKEGAETSSTPSGGFMAPTKPPILPPGVPGGPTIPPNTPPTSPLVAPARDTSRPSTNIRIPRAVMHASPATTKAFVPTSNDSIDLTGAVCGKVTAGFWECTKDGQTYYCTGNGTGCELIGRVNTKQTVIKKQQMGNKVYAPTTSTKPIEESPQDGYTPIGSPELKLHRMEK